MSLMSLALADGFFTAKATWEAQSSEHINFHKLENFSVVISLNIFLLPSCPLIMVFLLCVFDVLSGVFRFSEVLFFIYSPCSSDFIIFIDLS